MTINGAVTGGGTSSRYGVIIQPAQTGTVTINGNVIGSTGHGVASAAGTPAALVVNGNITNPGTSASAGISYGGASLTITGNVTLTSTHSFVGGDATGGAITITLPTAVGITGKIYYIKMLSSSSGTNTVTVGTTSSQTIDGSTTQVMTMQYTEIPVISNGSNWSIL